MPDGRIIGRERNLGLQTTGRCAVIPAWRKCMVVLAVALLCGPTAAPVGAFGRDDQWTSGSAQGIDEAIVTLGAGNRIYVTCGEWYGRSGHTSISFMIGGDSPKGDTVILTFDNENPEPISITQGVITSDCRACMETYLHVIGKLRKHSKVHVLTEDGESALFTLKGSKEAMGVCEPDFNAY